VKYRKTFLLFLRFLKKYKTIKVGIGESKNNNKMIKI